MPYVLRYFGFNNSMLLQNKKLKIQKTWGSEDKVYQTDTIRPTVTAQHIFRMILWSEVQQSIEERGARKPEIPSLEDSGPEATFQEVLHTRGQHHLPVEDQTPTLVFTSCLSTDSYEWSQAWKLTWEVKILISFHSYFWTIFKFASISSSDELWSLTEWLTDWLTDWVGQSYTTSVIIIEIEIGTE